MKFATPSETSPYFVYLEILTTVYSYTSGNDRSSNLHQQRAITGSIYKYSFIS